jgi:hypothetical protein
MIRAQWLGGPHDGAWVDLPPPTPEHPEMAVTYATVNFTPGARPSKACPIVAVKVPVLPHRDDGTYRIVWAARRQIRPVE